MRVCRPQFEAPVLVIDDFLCEPEAQSVFREAMDLKKVYVPARVFDDVSSTRIDTQVRVNEVVHLDDVFRGAPERSDILRIMKAKIWTPECRKLWHEGYQIFDIINYSTWQEGVLSCYGNDAFYKRHQDTRWDHITYRLVTLVYYITECGKHFNGGHLVLSENDSILRVEPRQNRAVIFPSFVFHEVERVAAENLAWENGRFSLNYWMGFK